MHLSQLTLRNFRWSFGYNQRHDADGRRCGAIVSCRTNQANTECWRPFSRRPAICLVEAPGSDPGASSRKSGFMRPTPPRPVTAVAHRPVDCSVFLYRNSDGLVSYTGRIRSQSWP